MVSQQLPRKVSPPDDPFPPPSPNHRCRRRHFPRPCLQKSFRSSSKLQPSACWARCRPVCIIVIPLKSGRIAHYHPGKWSAGLGTARHWRVMLLSLQLIITWCFWKAATNASSCQIWCSFRCARRHICDRIRTKPKIKMQNVWMYMGWNLSTDHIVPSLANLCCLHWGISFSFHVTGCYNGGLAHYVIAAAAVASHNVKHAWVLAWVASRFAASSCALRFGHFAIVPLFSWTKFFTKAKS